MKELYLNYKDIWHTHNPSGKLKRMKRAIKSRLRALDLPYVSDNAGNILVGNFDDPKPCIVAHMDSVHDKASRTIIFDGNMLSSDNGIGADDKAGIVSALECLKECDINAIFTVDEEVGCAGAGKLDFKALAKVSYFVELDRRGNNEVINNLAYPKSTSAEFEEALKPFMDQANFVFGDGTFTDLTEILPEVSIAGINLCAGYYEAHTIREYIILSELRKSILFCQAIFTIIRDQFKIQVDREILWHNDFYGSTNHDPQKCDYLYQLKDIAELYYGDDDMIEELLNRAYDIGARDRVPFDDHAPIKWY